MAINAYLGMDTLLEAANLFETQISKTAAKEQLGRNKVTKKLEKAKSEYSKLKSNLDSLEAQDSKLRTQLENARKATSSARSGVIKLHKAMQCMDLSNASDAVFYNDDSLDVGYIIDGKEYHLDVDDLGEMTLVPMRKFRSERKMSKNKSEDEGCAEDCMDVNHNHDQDETGSVEDEKSEEELHLDEEDLDLLYNSLME